MSGRLIRTAFRRSAPSNLQTTSALRVSRRMTSTSSSSSHGPNSHFSSDKPWIIGSLLIFGPAFLYLLSPSAWKSDHHNSEHKGKHENNHEVVQEEHPAKVEENAVPAPAPAAEQPSELMTDDEGTVADVASSVALSEATDVPQDAQSAEKFAELKSEGESEPSKTVEDTPSAPSDSPEGEERADEKPAPQIDIDHQAPKEHDTQQADDGKK